MKRKIILRLSYLIVFLAIFWSCHNEDFANGKAEPQRSNADFFRHSNKGGAAARSVVDYVAILEAYNREKDFLSTMPDQQGMPIWEKMQVVDTENATGLMIPLSHDDETMSSVLFATLDEENTVTAVKDYDNKLLENIVYNENIDHDLRERLFYTFMYVDNKTFGTEQFTGIPKDLFTGKKYDDKYGRIRIKNFTAGHEVQGSTSKILFIESCGSYWSCKNHESWSKCDHCSACYTTGCSIIMIYLPDEGFPGFPGSPGGGGGGGGGGTPGPEPPKDPCALTTVFYRIQPGCLGSGGNTGIDDLDDPCTKIKAKFEDPKFKEKVAAIDKPEVFAYDYEMGYAAGYPTTTGVTETQYDPMVNSPGTHSVTLPPGNQYFGFVHSHNNDTATEIHIKIFSPADVSTFLTSCITHADDHGSMGDAYAMVITAEGNYMLQYSGTGDYSIGQAQIDNWKTSYEDKFQKLIDQDRLTKLNVEKTFARFLKESVNISGLEVYYVEKNTGKASKINSDGSKTPCP